MASDNLREVGKYLKNANKKADQALKRYSKKLPKRERARDTLSSLYPFTVKVLVDEDTDRVSIDINFDTPSPNDCSSECVATSCQAFELLVGGYSLTVENPYESGSVSVFSNGVALSEIQWYEENPEAGQVYVQVQSPSEMIIVCYTYIVC